MENLIVICRYNGRIIYTTPVDSMSLAVKFLKVDAENTFNEINSAEKPAKEINETSAKVSCTHGVWTWEIKES